MDTRSRATAVRRIDNCVLPRKVLQQYLFFDFLRRLIRPLSTATATMSTKLAPSQGTSLHPSKLGPLSKKSLSDKRQDSWVLRFLLTMWLPQKVHNSSHAELERSRPFLPTLQCKNRTKQRDAKQNLRQQVFSSLRGTVWIGAKEKAVLFAQHVAFGLSSGPQL